MILSVSGFAQQITVNGHVKITTGEPIIGNTIRVSGVEGGTVAATSTNFAIRAQSDSTLSVSYIGYETQVVSAASNVVITLLAVQPSRSTKWWSSVTVWPARTT